MIFIYKYKLLNNKPTNNNHKAFKINKNTIQSHYLAIHLSPNYQPCLYSQNPLNKQYGP